MTDCRLTSKSFDFVKQRIGCVSSTCDNLTELHVNMLAKPLMDYQLEYKDGKKQSISAAYDPDADFDYVIVESLLCDGTFLHNELMMRAFIRMLSSYCIDSVPENYGADVEKYKVRYTIGNPVFGLKENNELEGKSRLVETVILPVKFEIEEIRND